MREIQREIRYLQSTLITAKSQLAVLINVDPGSNFSVWVPYSYKTPSLLGMSAEEMIGKALVSRSELREVAYKERINHNEAHAAILEMLPGITADVLPNFDSIKFLFSN